jgi:RecG-like helicase
MQSFKNTFRVIFSFFIFVSLVACTSRISQQNFEKVQPGMTMQQVVQILGEPTTSESVNIAGIAGTSATWKDRNGVIVIQFFNDQAKIKTFSKGSQQQPSGNAPSDNGNNNLQNQNQNQYQNQNQNNNSGGVNNNSPQSNQE